MDMHHKYVRWCKKQKKLRNVRKSWGSLRINHEEIRDSPENSTEIKY